MKYLKIYENFDFNEDNFDFEENEPESEIKSYKDCITNYVDDFDKPGGGFVNGKIYYIEFKSHSQEIKDFINIIEDDSYYLLGDESGGKESYIILWSDEQYSICNFNSFDNLSSGVKINGTTLL